VIDLRFLESKGILSSNGPLFNSLFSEKKFVFCEDSLNEFMRLGFISKKNLLLTIFFFR